MNLTIREKLAIIIHEHKNFQELLDALEEFIEEEFQSSSVGRAEDC